MTDTTAAGFFLALGPHCWGCSASREEAVRLARQEWPSFHRVKRPTDQHFSIYTSAARMNVDGMGYIHSAAPVTKVQTSTLASPE